MKEHVNNLMVLCNQRTYLITQLKQQGLPQEQLQTVFMQSLYRVYLCSTCVTRLFKLAEIDCLQSVLDKAKRLEINLS